ncbi:MULTISPECIES: DUF6266 family protein [Flavobacteriaceae]|uniref:Uncharacterized protein n=2 Tax=Flavobacteriaceae TaxID=49546 RepID=A0A4Y8AVE7_9FLAO|nr:MULTISPECIES: DUF6266 family protein [Flavobacteriaceae]TEW76481.1 hypothetical protein E2488_01130 [Gramella jeungdoensis]GGK53297.1 hypothetical protein GCM10007963_22040 [Lutibacter litoralis]
MGKIAQGILGGLSGKVGNIIGGSWKGIDYIRIKPSSVANPRTVGQVNQRNKFSATLEFLQPNKDFLNVGYKNFAIKKTAFNAAMSEILANAITGVAPDFTVDYENALLSKGTLPGVLDPAASYTTPGQVGFSWTDNSTGINALETDKAMLLVYNPAKKESVANMVGSTRVDEGFSLAVPANYAGDLLYTYIAFVSIDGKVSNSSYISSGVVS